MEIREFAEAILFGTSLKDKLLRPEVLTDDQPWNSIDRPQFPGRPLILMPGLKTRRPFPKDHQLDQGENRAAILHFFANHELLAMELMALALLKFPDAPKAFRRGIAETIFEEQDHMILYQKRMESLGMELGEIAVNDFFWNSLKDMASPMDYVTGMSMTFEQANLDYSRHYIRLMNRIGDHETSTLLDKVYQDEIGHVKYGVTWFDRWRSHERSQWSSHRLAMFGRQPLTIARAKGIGFDRDGRLRAGFSGEYVDAMEVFENPKGRCPKLYWYNADCELENAHGKPGYSPSAGVKRLMADFELLPMFVASNGDALLCQNPPSLSYQRYLKDRIGKLVEFIPWQGSKAELRDLCAYRSFSALQPWGWTPRAKELEAAIEAKSFRFQKGPEFNMSIKSLFEKTHCPDLRHGLRQNPDWDSLMGPQVCDGKIAFDSQSVWNMIQGLHDSGLHGVVKSPFGFSGAGQCRIFLRESGSDSQRGWIAKQLSLHGKVIVEPWLDRVLDGSLIWNHSDSDVQATFFLTDDKGRYRGHKLGPLAQKIAPSLRPYVLGHDHTGQARLDQILKAGKKLQTYVREKGYKGPAGVDFFVFRWPHDGQLYCKILGEINGRMTMAHVATALEKNLRLQRPHLWLTITLSEVKQAGYDSVKTLANEIKEQVASEQDILFTNDPETALGAVSFLLGDQNVLRLLDKKFNLHLRGD
ncbi:DUF455 family protein [Pseudobacteriovorax antillogorgiicola]|uniref:Uncharacterized conserved protein, contains ferritin-like DUF455 domain n=1 Tax=Pseudobacteriovorax antillogorgiicola TaxID=1513793 RepID=A0A1Y6C213_9BACT|nr:DUF455 family protein [Pseudobacteriovorax antillogorgiicola]TCS50218.1 uncharacterized ferritin-like protein (DUF455 family) [Pseudobacteriovorax antillogorgiicola]SMF32544.1 Uncharacterized conserved protein, contains ferritin-like DUF455 domain [Pseudobacteriovorax antillogorgiicola]